jgi:hypothetical protein
MNVFVWVCVGGWGVCVCAYRFVYAGVSSHYEQHYSRTGNKFNETQHVQDMCALRETLAATCTYTQDTGVSTYGCLNG